MPDREIPDNVKPVFNAFFDDVSNLFNRYKIFKQVYGSEEAVNLLNESAPGFFSEIRAIMLENLLILISQLTDVPLMGGRENLSVQKLIDVIEAHQSGLSQVMGLNVILTQLKDHVKPIREIRNRTLAHNDWGRRNVDLPIVMKKGIDDSLEALQEVLRVISLHFRDVDLRCEPFAISDGDDLIAVLRQWRDYSKKDQPERWAGGD